MAATPAPSVTADYSERLLPGPLGWALVLMIAAFMALALYPVNPTIAFSAGVLVAIVGVVVILVTTPRVEIAGGELRAGPAHIPVALLGAARALDATETRVELGVGLDARAYVCLRAWARTAVRVEVEDPDDRTPYWLVSTRHPHALAGAITAAREPGAPAL